MTIEVRPIRRGEGGALVAMVRALAEPHGFLGQQTGTAGDLERALFADEAIVGCLLAFIEGKAAGCAFWHRSFTAARGGEVIYLEDLLVLPEFRRKGVTRALLKALAGEAKRPGYPSIYRLMKSWNEGARALYAQAGAEIEEGIAFCRLADDALSYWAETAT
jgi:GNAT superfamily N-acetyltransferase